MLLLAKSWKRLWVISWKSIYMTMTFYLNFNQVLESHIVALLLQWKLWDCYDVIEALYKKQHCVSLFIDLAKTFDTVDHNVMIQRLLNIGLADQALSWFNNYLSDRTQYVQFEGKVLNLLPILNGIPQGLVLGPLLFTIYINNVGRNETNAHFHFYADDTVLHCCPSNLNEAFDNLQSAFNIVQS